MFLLMEDNVNNTTTKPINQNKMKGTINLHEKWGWGVMNHMDESIPDWIPLHPDDLTHFAEMKEKFDNFEARVLSSPEVEFETIIHPKFTGRIIYAKLNTKKEPKQESPEEPTMIDDWLNEYGDPEIYKKVERELELREGASKWSLEEAQEFALSKFTKDSNPKKGVVKWEDILEVLKVGVLTGHKFGAKWQQKRMYSEEEVQVKLYECLGHFAQKHNIIIEGSEIDQWFEQFKKK